jgi:DNA-binding GntR family transcriptional regulator
MKITQDDLLDALRHALEAPNAGDAPTVNELQVTMGCGSAKVRRALKALAAQGRLEVVQVRRTSLTGIGILCPGYRIKPKGKRAA